MNHLSEAIETIKIISSKYFPGNFIIHLDVCCDCGQLLSFISTVHMTPKYTPRTVPNTPCGCGKQYVHQHMHDYTKQYFSINF